MLDFHQSVSPCWMMSPRGDPATAPKVLTQKITINTKFTVTEGGITLIMAQEEMYSVLQWTEHRGGELHLWANCHRHNGTSVHDAVDVSCMSTDRASSSFCENATNSRWLISSFHTRLETYEIKTPAYIYPTHSVSEEYSAYILTFVQDARASHEMCFILGL